MPKEGRDRPEGQEILDYVTHVRENTRRYVEELRAENERFRLLTSSLESERLLLENKLVAIQSELELQVSERNKLSERIQEVEGERIHIAEGHADIEEQNNNLANLYVATYGLHGTLDRSQVICVIKEIITNLIGSEEMAIFELETNRDTLELLSSQGIELEPYRSMREDSGVIWDAIRSGSTYVNDTANPEAHSLPHEANLTACVPLKIDGRVTGAIALFRLLQHKQGLESLDNELFDLLASQAAIALHCTKLSSIPEALEAHAT
jgi:hypothetical protein